MLSVVTSRKVSDIAIIYPYLSQSNQVSLYSVIILEALL